MIVRNETSSLSEQPIWAVCMSLLPDGKRIEANDELVVPTAPDHDLRFTKTSQGDVQNLFITGYDTTGSVKWSEVWLAGNREKTIPLNNPFYNVYKVAITTETF